MCGIVGYLNFNAPAKSEYVEKMLSLIKHRGRDHSGMYTSHDGKLILGHQRLSIIDLSDSANQPMHAQDKGLVLCFNGEIYNFIELRDELKKSGYCFSTNSDSEVLLNAYHYWGKEALQKINGMYAFAIWDIKAKELFCARDPFGIKPFYYYYDNNHFIFSSESLAISHVRQTGLSFDALGLYLLCGYVPGNLSIFDSIKKLPPGHQLTINHQNKLEEKRYFLIKDFDHNTLENHTIGDIENQLRHSIHIQLRSDVKIGSFLSGGIDSGLITALAAQECSDLSTYSIGYEGLEANELPLARELAGRYNTNHHEHVLKMNEIIPTLNKAISGMCEPIADSAIVAAFTLSNMAKNDDIKVLLNGTGGDELFGGYHRYSSTSFKRFILRHMPFSLRKVISNCFPQLNTVRLSHPVIDSMLNTGGIPALFKASYNTYLPKSLLATVNKYYPKIYMSQKSYYPLMLADLLIYVPDQLLLLLDQMTMHHTLEARVPFLDPNLATLSYQLSPSSHVKGNHTKILLRHIAEKHLGAKYIAAKKQGFGGPVTYWVNENKSEFLDRLYVLKDVCFLRDINWQKLLSRLNKRTQTQAIFRLYCLAVWYEKIKDCAHGRRIG